jgi:KDO2-lipid IV(A) lauroyltransferase
LGHRLLTGLRTLGRLPGPLLVPIGWLLGLAGLLFRRRANRRALRHLARAFPDQPASQLKGLARAAAAHHGARCAAWLSLPHLTPDARMARFDISGLEAPVRAALAAEQGAIVITAHLGHWEGLAAALAAATGDVMMISRRVRSTHAWDLVDQLRRPCEVRSCSFSNARLDAARWLKLNRIVIVVADSDAGREGIFLPYFGLPASVTPLPVRLAADTGAPCLAAFTLKGPGGYRIQAHPLEVPHGATPEAQERGLRRWLGFLEEAVRQHPTQYVWEPRRWRTRPARDFRQPIRLKALENL